MKKRRTNYKGYTLVELLVVMLISGILLSMGAVEYGTATSESKIQSFHSSVLTALSGAESYRQKYGEYPDTDTFNALLRDQRYFSIPPKNPYTGKTLQATTDTSSVAKNTLGYFYYSLTPDGNIKVETNPPLDIDVAQMEEPEKGTTSTYSVSFTVVDGNGSPISGAQIMINGKTLTTDAQGKATTALAAGTYFYSATKTGYNFVNGSLNVSGNTSKTISMTSSSFTVTVIVKNESGDPIMGARVTGIGSGEQTTDAEGKATFTGISAGTYNIVATATGYEQTSLAVTVKSNQQVRLTMPKQRLYTVSVVVTDTKGNPIEGAVIKGIGSGGVTGSDGKATIANVLAGNYTITAVANGYGMSSQTISVSGNQSVSFTLTQLLYSVTVHVTDADTGAAISGASVTGIGSGGTTDANGNVTFNDVTPGVYNLTISAANYNSYVTVVTADSSKGINVALTRQKAAAVTIHVRDSYNSSGVSGAQVTMSNGMGTLNTNSSGDVTFAQIPYGSYTVQVVASNYKTQSVPITVNQKNQNITVQLARSTYAIYVYVTDAETGAAISGANVNIYGVGSQTTDSSGRTTFWGVVWNTYSIGVSKSGYYGSSGEVTVSNSSIYYNVALKPEYRCDFTVHVTIKDSDGTRLDGKIARVTVSGYGIDGTLEKLTDEYGTAVFPNIVAEYYYSVTAEWAGFSTTVAVKPKDRYCGASIILTIP